VKLKKSAKTDFDLAQSIYQKIAEEYSQDIRVVGSLPKDEPSDQLHFWCRRNVKSLGDRIAMTNSKRFNTPSNVHRAAHYMGMLIIYHLFAEGKDDSVAASFYQTLAEIERVTTHLDEIEQAVVSVKKLFWGKKVKLYPEEKFQKHLKSILDHFPKRSQEIILSQADRSGGIEIE